MSAGGTVTSERSVAAFIPLLPVTGTFGNFSRFVQANTLRLLSFFRIYLGLAVFQPGAPMQSDNSRRILFLPENYKHLSELRPAQARRNRLVHKIAHG